MTPKQFFFENPFPYVSRGHGLTFRGQIWWKSTVGKLPKSRLVYRTEKRGAIRHQTHPSPPFCPSGPIMSKISWTLSPLDTCMCTKFGLDRLRFARVMTKRLIYLDAQSHYNIGWSLSVQAFSLQHTRCAYRVQTPPTPKCQPKLIQDSNPDLWINLDVNLDVCWIATKMLWIYYLVGVRHFAKFLKNRPVTVWEMLRNLLKSPISQWWGKWKSDLKSTSGFGSTTKFNHF